ncbi:MAG: hypothetical protein COX55_09025 [Zetaproteobacteria bacterium CG23_combo_of_CG06-09_8_20_14_all_54_7]|nr:MAG: hypothetical protein COX55_09025 [Zetaproteobacteria bacterium CG23_combo_of_CG06-09_8_20_14_all_54_7]
MSVVAIRAALETALNGMSPALATAWENAQFMPVAGTPYQQVHLLFATPSNREMGDRYQEIGYLQCKLMYPLAVGTATIAARAMLLRTTFKRGNTFVSGGITTTVTETPEIVPGRVEGDRYAVSVKIKFVAQVNG